MARRRGSAPVAMQEPLIGDHRAVGEDDLARAAANRADGGAGAVGDVLAAPGVLVVEGEIGERLLAGQHALRQRRALVGRVGLGADQGDRPLPAGGAERMGGPAAGVPGADDDHAAGIAHDRAPGQARAEAARGRPNAAGSELQGIARSLTHVLPIILGGLALQSR